MTINPLTLQLVGNALQSALEVYTTFQNNPEISPEQLMEVRAVNKSKEEAALRYIRKRREQELLAEQEKT